MKRSFLIAAGVLCSLMVWAQAPSVDIDWNRLLSDEPYSLGSTNIEISQNNLHDLLEIGKNANMNVFRLLAAVGGQLKKRGARIAIRGDQLRTAEKTYGLGNARVYAFLPIEKIELLRIGAPEGGGPELEVVLTRPHQDYLELGDFFLDVRYGFKAIADGKLFNAYGARVKKGPFSFSLSHIELIDSPHDSVNPNYIAIHVNGFPRPKRWSITPIYAK